MRTRSIFQVVTIVGISLTVGNAAFADEASVRKEMYAIFDKSVKQFRAKDIKGFMTMVADDYKGKGPRGEPQTKATMEAEMKRAMEGTQKLTRAELKINKLSVNGNTAQVESTMTLDMTVVDKDGAMGPKGKSHTVVDVERSKETWVRTKSGWKVKIGEALPGAKTLIDGKPFVPPSAPPKKS